LGDTTITNKLKIALLFGTIFLCGLNLLPSAYAQAGQGFTVTSVSLTNILHPGQNA
jgi:hypothetical protein